MSQDLNQTRASVDPRSKEEEVIGAVREAIRRIEFGSVLIKIHQGEGVGLETSTKVRIEP